MRDSHKHAQSFGAFSRSPSGSRNYVKTSIIGPSGGKISRQHYEASARPNGTSLLIGADLLSSVRRLNVPHFPLSCPLLSSPVAKWPPSVQLGHLEEGHELSGVICGKAPAANGSCTLCVRGEGLRGLKPPLPPQSRRLCLHHWHIQLYSLSALYKTSVSTNETVIFI
jgi:hypothetical protein